MNACRKIAALALCAILLVSLMSMGFAADAAPALQFDENGEFKILIVADTQDIDKPQKETIALLEAELDAAQPDLVVFLGTRSTVRRRAGASSARRRRWTRSCSRSPSAGCSLPSSSATMTMRAASARKRRWNTIKATLAALRRRAM